MLENNFFSMDFGNFIEQKFSLQMIFDPGYIYSA